MQNQISNNWQKVKLGDITEYVNRGIPPVYTQDTSGTAVINQKCIRNGQVDFGLSRLTDESVKPISQDKLLQQYDILINSTGTGTVGRVGQIMDLTKKASVDTHVTIVRPKKEAVDPTYLGYWMKTKQEELESLAGGSTNQVELSRAKIEEISVILPPLNAQKKISEIIATLDIAITKTDQIIQKTEVLKQGLIRELLTKGIGHTIFKQTKLGNIPESWEVTTLDTCADISTGTTPSTSKSHYYQGSNLFIKTTDIANNRIVRGNVFITDEAIKTYRLKIYLPGTIMMAMYGEGKTRGQVALLEVNASTSQNAAAIIPNQKINSEFLWFYLLGQYLSLRNSGVQGQISHLNLGYVKKIELPLPSIKEQQEIVEILKAVEHKLFFNQAHLEKLKLFKKGLIQDIFSQKVRIS